MRKKLSNLNQSVYALRVMRISYLWILIMYLTGCSNKIVEIPIALHKAGSVAEADFEIAQDDGIELLLFFSVNDQSDNRKHLREFLDNEPRVGNAEGIPVPLKVKLVKYTDTIESVVLDKTYVTTRRVWVGQNLLIRQVDTMPIKSGRYRIRLETIEAFPQLSNTKVQLEIYYFRRK